MPLVRVTDNYRVKLPASVRRKAGLVVGDVLEAKVQGRRITLTPKRRIDREIALGLEDFRRGRFVGPFRTAKTAVRALRRAAT